MVDEIGRKSRQTHCQSMLYSRIKVSLVLFKLCTVKILIDSRVFFRIMFDAEVGSGLLLEATVLECNKQLCGMSLWYLSKFTFIILLQSVKSLKSCIKFIWNLIYGRLIKSNFFLKFYWKWTDFYWFYGDRRLLGYGRLLKFYGKFNTKL